MYINFEIPRISSKPTKNNVIAKPGIVGIVNKNNEANKNKNSKKIKKTCICGLCVER
jgi:hypothetical protein